MALNKKSIEDVSLKGKRVLIRCDFNVPIIDGKITDENRLIGAVDTIKYASKNGGRVILCSHLGKAKGPDETKSLKIVGERLSEILNINVKFVPSDLVVDDDVRKEVNSMKEGEIILIENTRFRPEEGKCEDSFSKDLASLCDIYVNDAFGTAHRAHCSTVGVTKFVDESVCGYLIQRELKFLGDAVLNPKRPFVAILGGAKVSDKINVINNLLDKVDTLIIGGGMAYTFLKAQGYSVGTSLVEEDKLDYAKDMIEKAKVKGVKLLLPIDHVVADKFDNNANRKNTSDQNIEDGFMGLDIGVKTCELFSKILEEAKTVIWNGPMGVFEFSNFNKGTIEVAKAMAESNATTIIGGGDSAAAVNILGFGDRMTHISTGGGASLEFLEGKILPGIDALDSKRKIIIAGNWKMNFSVKDTEDFLSDFISKVQDINHEVVICPPFTSLQKASCILKNSNVKLGAQNVHFEESGAFTGEISPLMLKDFNVEYVIIGHSERRMYFGEKDEDVNKKIFTCLNHGFTPIVCVGETLEQRESGKTEIILKEQVEKAFLNISKEDVQKIVVAYEPVWAIGTGKTATSEDADNTIGFIRDTIKGMYDGKISDSISILYGGSVKPDTIESQMSMSNIDGALVGGASMNIKDFELIVKF